MKSKMARAWFSFTLKCCRQPPRFLEQQPVGDVDAVKEPLNKTILDLPES